MTAKTTLISIISPARRQRQGHTRELHSGWRHSPNVYYKHTYRL